MRGDIWTYAWYVAAFVLVSYAAHLFVGGIVASDTRIRLAEIRASHRIEGRAHIISGMIESPSSCIVYSLNVYAKGASHQHLAFATQKIDMACDHERTPRSFRVTIPITAPDEHFTASVDGKTVPLILSK